MSILEKLPTGAAREALREKGQFFTPGWVADAMVSFAGRGAKALYDPGFGLGAFSLATDRVFGAAARDYAGCDTDPTVWSRARDHGVREDVLEKVKCVDFFTVDRLPDGTSVVSNPPYVRHHRLETSQKEHLRALGTRTLGRALDGRTGIHAYFLIHALNLLPKGQRLAFIVPSDICEGVYAKPLWKWITSAYRVQALVTFSPEASPFPGVDTNAVVLLISNESPGSEYSLARVKTFGTDALSDWIKNGLPVHDMPDLVATRRTISDGVRDGVSRFPLVGARESGLVLGDFVKVVRGIATGANEFFFLTSKQIESLGLPQSVLVRAVGRTRDITSEVVSPQDLVRLDEEGRPTFLLSLDGSRKEDLLPEIRNYLAIGEEQQLHTRALIAMRNPWYKMEKRVPPPFLFAYLGRRETRFVENRARLVPLTSFLCVYNRPETGASDAELGRLLADPELHRALPFVAKSYGGGAIKLEPRSLERVPLLPDLIVRHNWILNVEPTLQRDLAI
ncbi:MAG: N-6 DNA methylase [Gemmatimonadaceae bacterium]